MSNIRVIPSQANAIRAARAANPTLSDGMLAAKLGVNAQLVGMALQRGDRRRKKSVAS